MKSAARPTPADPLPGREPENRFRGRGLHMMPPELGPDAVAIYQGRSFMYSNATGDVPQGTFGGFVHDDTRFVSRWELTVNGARLYVLRSGLVDPYSALFFLTNSDLPGIPPNRLDVRRERYVDGGLHERLRVRSFADEPVSIQLRLGVASDFRDIFEMKRLVLPRDRTAQISRAHAADGSRLEFAYRNGTYEVETQVHVTVPASRVDGDDLVWDLRLDPGIEWECEVAIPVRPERVELLRGPRHFGEVFERRQEDLIARWRTAIPVLHSDFPLLDGVYETGVVDLIALRVEEHPRDQAVALPAAGLPWYLTMMGRDALITGYQILCFGWRLPRGTLLSLAALQGRDRDDFRDEEPGKILHEYRTGELTRVGTQPFDPYFGSADATALWLILLSEYWRWTGDYQIVRDLRDNAYAALRWIDEFGDRDGDGYVEYGTRSPQGLGNQCWRDSWDGVQYADGSMPVLPIATCEIQGYTYDAKLRLAELADGPLDDRELARRLRAEAEELRKRFNRDFWIAERGGYYALGLDGDKRRIDAMTSNMGHLLWSGIVPPERAAIVARHLMSEQLFTGWGVRTTSAEERWFNPIGYHTGTVWPHDNSLIAHGLARYGFRNEANRIVMAMLRAASHFGYRLPEAICGYDRDTGRMPVPYPTACDPQSWASGAASLLVRTILGLEPGDGHPTASPYLPPEIGRISLRRTNAFAKHWDVEVTKTTCEVRLAP